MVIRDHFGHGSEDKHLVNAQPHKRHLLHCSSDVLFVSSKDITDEKE